MAQYILALDQGTTSSRAIVFGQDGRSVSRAQRPIRQIYPQPGWVEHDPREIVETQIEVAREALAQAGLSAHAIAAVGITNQRETTVVWDRDTGAPVHNAIVWQCRRTAPDCDGLREKGLEPLVRDRTGLLLDAYFSASKVRWILDNVPGARARAEAGDLLFGTIDAWLIWNLTGGAVHATDPSNASRTMLMDLGAAAWDPALCDAFSIPPSMLPEIRPSSGPLGVAAPEVLGGPVPIASAIGDQQGALFGHGCFDTGAVKVTYGTGCFALVNIASPVHPPRGLLTSAAWTRRGATRYALEGSVFVAGAVVQWLRDELGLIGTAEETEVLARSVTDTCGAYLVPAFVGLGAPHWDPTARGALVGLTRGVGKAHLARAALESIAYQTADVLEVMAEGSQLRLEELHVDGGASANNWLMQFQSDIIGIPVVRSAELETTARGAAFLAGLAVGYWSGTDELRALCTEGARFEPRMEPADRRRLRVGWESAIDRARGWVR